MLARNHGQAYDSSFSSLSAPTPSLIHASPHGLSLASSPCKRGSQVILISWEGEVFQVPGVLFIKAQVRENLMADVRFELD